MPEQQSEQASGGVKLFLGTATVALHAFAASAETLMHVGMGWLYPVPMIRIIAVGLPYLWALLWAEKIRRQGYEDSLVPLLTLPSLLVYAMLAQWCLSILVRRRTYSRYTGFPLLKLPLFFLDEVLIKAWIQPALLMGGSWWFYAWNRPLMSFVFAVGVGLFLVGRQRSLNTMFREQGYTDALYKSW